MAQFTATYTLSGGNDVTSLAFNGSNPTGATFGALTKVGITSSSSSGNFRGTSWPTATTPDLGKYIQFTVTVQANYVLNLSSVTFGVGRSGTGPVQWQWRSSIGSYGAAISTYTTVNSGLTHASGTLTNPDANQGWTGNVLNLSGASYQGLPAGTYNFRLYAFNSEAAGGTGGLQGNISIAGTVTPAAPPTPTVTVNATSFNGAFGNVTVGQFSGASSFTVSGSNLGTNNLVVTAPTGFQVRKGAEAYAGSTSITPSSGSVSTTTINVRFAPASAGPQSGSVTIVSGTTSGTSQAVSGNGVAVVAPEKLAITTVNGGSDVVQGQPFSLVVQAQDINSVSQNVTSTTAISLSAAGPGTLAGTLTGNIAAGTNSVTFTGLSYDQAHAGVVFTATRTSGDALTNANSTPVPVLGPAQNLAFVNVPTSGGVGQPLATFSVQARRSGGQVASEYNGVISLSVASGPGGISGGSATAVNGVATFTNVTLSAQGIHTLTATATGLDPATSTSINILSAPTSIYSNPIDDVPGVGQPNAQNPYVFGNIQDQHLSVTGLGRGAGITGTGAGGRYNANAWNVSSLTTNKYFYWKFSPEAGYTIDLFSLTGNWQSSGSGPTAYALRSSLDGYSTDIATGTIANTGNASVFTISLAAATLDAITTEVEFRLYAWGTTNSAGTFSINDFTFTGNVIPPPAATATFTQTAAGIATSPLEGGSIGHRLLGLSAASDASVSTLPTTQVLTGLSLSASASPIGSITNVRLVDESNVVIGTFTLTESALESMGINVPLGATTNYYVVADVVSTVTTATPALTFSVSVNDITVSGGQKSLLPTDPVNSTEYAFSSSTLPVLSTQPESLHFGQLCAGTSEEVNVLITGANLTGDVVLGPLEGFLFLDPEDIFGDFQESLVLSPVGGELDKEIIVLFEPGAGIYDTPIPVTNAAVDIVLPVTAEGVDTPPTVVTGVASAEGTTQVSLSGSVPMDGEGCSALTAVGIEYSATPGFSPGMGTQVPAVSGSDWTVEITELNACTTYYYRAYATNNGGTSYGVEQQFSTTAPAAPLATTATEIFSTGFTANWEEVPGATGYVLDVSTLPDFAVENYGADLFISEYIEGSGNNKYVEIYNPTASTVNLSDYSLRLHANGANPGTIAALSGGTLAPGAVAVYRNSGASITTYPTLSTVNWNGDDAFELVKGGVSIDLFGPTPTGSSPGNFAADVTLRRNAGIIQGSTSWWPSNTVPSAQWTAVTPVDNVSGLGVHTSAAPSSTPSFVAGYEARSVNASSYTVTGLTLGVTYYYRVRAIMGEGCTSSNSTVVSTTTACDPVTVAPVTSNSPICNVDDLLLGITVTGGEGTPTFSWSGAGTFSPDATSTDVEVSGATSGTYSVEVSNGCSSTLAQVLVDVTPATAWYSDTDGDGYGDPNSQVLACEAPEDHVADNTDDCPELTGHIGDTCDDQDPGTSNDVITADCECAGTPVLACTTDLTLEFRSDAPEQTTWEIRDANTNAVLRSGGPLNGSPETNMTCLPDGCFVLRVLDSGGDGMVGGGYVLRTSGPNGLRIIDNSGNFTSGSVSQMTGGESFCLPLGTTQLIHSSCDKLDWTANKFIVVAANPAVSAQFGVTNATSGYEFWFFDPNGSYSFRRFRSHATSDGYGTGALRANHFKVNGWINSVATPHLPNGVLLNVRVRSRVAGNNLEFGPACQFKLDAALAACPRVKLQDDPANTDDYSCGVTRRFGSGNTATNRITANPPQPIPVVASASVRYQFRFRIPGEGICIVRPPQTSARIQLNWNAASGAPLLCSKTYDVDVRVSLDGGATWCFGPTASSQVAACGDSEDWGKVCKVTISGCAQATGGSSSMVVDANSSLTMYPNPNRGDQLFVSLSSVEEGVGTVSVDIFDLTGKKVTARTIAVQDGFVKTALELNGELANGMYLVNITAGGKAYTERLVIQK